MRTLLMHDLVVDSPFAEALAVAGHEVVRCSLRGIGFPCSGARGQGCPLDAPTDVAVVVHDKPTADISPGEAGVVCALRDGVPLVVAGNGSQNAFGDRVDAIAASPDDVASACERAVAAREAKATRAIAAVTGLRTRVVIAGAEVRVSLPERATERDAIEVHRVTRRLFPAAAKIDVARGRL